MPTDLARYYARRAAEYERIYHKPERRHDLALLREQIPPLFAGRVVLELACGTGYWTEQIARVARSVVATDLNPEVLALAQRKDYPAANVRFVRADAFDLGTVGGRFSAAFAGFWWSHVLRAERAAFLGTLHHRLGAGARVVFLDNRYVEGSSTPIARRDAGGNTYQLRTLDDGTRHEVLKNFPSEAEVRAALAQQADVTFAELDYYWYVAYHVQTK